MTNAREERTVIITTDPSTLRSIARRMEERYKECRIGETTFVDFLGHLSDGTNICIHFDQQVMDKEYKKP